MDDLMPDLAYRPADVGKALTGESVGAVLARHARQVPDRVAVVEGDPGNDRLRTVTYRELYDGAALTMSGYLDDPGHTATVLTGDGWLRTGDLCSMDAGGVISIHGRLREVIVRGGENVYPAEVEAVLRRHPAVAEVAVIGVPDRWWGEQVTAFVRFRPGAAVAWPELDAHARERLAAFKVPGSWREVDEFPLTASGKVQKFRLLEA